MARPVYKSAENNQPHGVLPPTEFSLDIIKHGPEIFSDSPKQTLWEGCLCQDLEVGKTDGSPETESSTEQNLTISLGLSFEP